MSHWILLPRRRPEAAVRLFCFPYAGVGATAFRGWADGIGSRAEVVCLQPPGRESRLREPSIPVLASLAQEAATAIAPLLDRPYAVLGHSLGAVVAFETVRELRRRGRLEPHHLFVAAARAPHLPWPHPPLRHLDALALVREVNERYGGTVPRPVLESAEFRDLFVPGLRADLVALETYEYTADAPFRSAITAFVGTADRMAPESVVREWARHTTGPFTLRQVTGGHLFLHSARAEMIAAVNAQLESTVAAIAGEAR